MEHVKVICEKYDINIHIINGYKKDNFKQLVKSKINTSVNNEIWEASQQKTKLRFIKEYSQKQYISELDFKRCKMMMKINKVKHDRNKVIIKIRIIWDVKYAN